MRVGERRKRQGDFFQRYLPGKGLGKFRGHVTTQGQISGRSLMWGLDYLDSSQTLLASLPGLLPTKTQTMFL